MIKKFNSAILLCKAFKWPLAMAGTGTGVLATTLYYQEKIESLGFWGFAVTLGMMCCVFMMFFGSFFWIWDDRQNKADKEREAQEQQEHLDKYGVDCPVHIKLTGTDLQIVLEKLNPSESQKKAIYNLGIEQGYLTIKDINIQMEEVVVAERDAGFLKTLNEIMPECRETR